jgi:hypothetical protein
VAFPTEADLARLRYENAHVALFQRARRAEAELVKATEYIDQLKKQISALKAELRSRQP